MASDPHPNPESAQPQTPDTRSEERRDLDLFSSDPKYHAKKINGMPDPALFVDVPWLPRSRVARMEVPTTLGEFVDGDVRLVLDERARGYRQTSVARFWHDYGSAGAHIIEIVRIADLGDGDTGYLFVVLSLGDPEFWTREQLLAEWPRGLCVHVQLARLGGVNAVERESVE